MLRDRNRDVLSHFGICISLPYTLFVLKFVVFIAGGGCRCGVCDSCDAGVFSCAWSKLLDWSLLACVLGGMT